MEIQEFIEKFRSQLEDETVEITPSTDYAKSEFWDSLTNMVIKVMIEDDYGVDIAPEKIQSFNSIQELFTFVQNAK